jgi:hypothetical protein
MNAMAMKNPYVYTFSEPSENNTGFTKSATIPIEN